MILVTGATGKVGSEVVRQLTAAGTGVRALVRDLGKAAGLGGGKAELVEGDMARPETLAAALTGVDTVVLVGPPDPSLATLEGNVIDVAKRHGGIRIVKVSALGAADDSPARFLRWHAESERHLRESGLPATVLRPHSFMQNLLGFATSIAEHGTIFAPARDGKVSIIDVRDVAAAAVAVATAPAGKTHDGKTYVLTGPEAITYRELAVRLGKGLDRPVLYVDVPASESRQQMLAMGLPEDMAEGILELYRLFASGQGEVVTDAVQKLTGKPPRTLEEFARDHAQVFARA